MAEHLKRETAHLGLRRTAHATGNTKVEKANRDAVSVEMVENNNDEQPLIAAKQEVKFEAAPIKHRSVILPFVNEMYIMSCGSFVLWIVSVAFSMCVASGRYVISPYGFQYYEIAEAGYNVILFGIVIIRMTWVQQISKIEGEIDMKTSSQVPEFPWYTTEHYFPLLLLAGISIIQSMLLFGLLHTQYEEYGDTVTFPGDNLNTTLSTSQWRTYNAINLMVRPFNILLFMNVSLREKNPAVTRPDIMIKYPGSF
jgi:hypothetical protein